MELNCSGIVINSYDFQDKHKIIVLLTDTLGKISVIFKNSKVLKSSNRESSLLYSVSEFKLSRGKNFHYIISSYFEKGFQAEYYENYETASKIIKIVNKCLPDDYINPKIYFLTRNFIAYVEKMYEENNYFVLSSYILKFLYFLGHKPDFSNCLCENNSKYVFDICRSVVYCSECCEDFSNTVRFDREYAEIIKQMLKWDYTTEKIIQSESNSEIYEILLKYLKYHFGG